jgi:hypothetical protein
VYCRGAQCLVGSSLFTARCPHGSQETQETASTVQARIDGLYELAQHDPTQAIPELERLIATYPHILTFSGRLMAPLSAVPVSPCASLRLWSIGGRRRQGEHSVHTEPPERSGGPPWSPAPERPGCGSASAVRPYAVTERQARWRLVDGQRARGGRRCRGPLHRQA